MASFNLSPVYQTPQFSNAGQLLVGGKLYWYLAGTSTPVTVYQDYQGAAAHTQPIVLDARGEPPAPVWLAAGKSYKAILQDSAGAQLQVIDNITGVGDTVNASGAFTQVVVNSTNNRAMLFQGASGDLELTVNLDSGTQATYKFQSTGLVFPDGTAQPTAGYTGLRNKLVNGGMLIDQRNNGGLVTQGTAAGQYCVDRWQIYGTASSKFTAQQAVTGAGMYYLAITSTAATSVGTSDYYTLSQKIEGLNCTDLFWGTVNAKTVTLSFSVYSSLTGTFGGSVQNSGGGRSYPFSYTISAANTWTTIAITIPGDTAGTWLQSNGVGIQVNFDLGSGATYRGTAGAWAGANYQSSTGCVNTVNTSGATFYIGQVQLEKSPTATPFEYKPVALELTQCQRYFYKFYGMQFATGANASGNFTGQALPLPTLMRATPTVTQSNVTYGNATSVATTAANAGMVVSVITASAAGNAYGQMDLSMSAEL